MYTLTMTQSRLTTCDRCGAQSESQIDLDAGWVRVYRKGEIGKDLCSTCWSQEQEAMEKIPKMCCVEGCLSPGDGLMSVNLAQSVESKFYDPDRWPDQKVNIPICAEHYGMLTT
jgi:hypothetical protein